MDSHGVEERIDSEGRQDGGLTLAHGVALAALLAVIALVAIALFGGGSYRVTAIFANAGQLVKGNQVRVGDRPVGTVTNIELDEDARARVTMQLDGEFDPLHEGTTATVRAPSLSGIANRYVSLNLGPDDGAEIADGGEISADATAAPVDLDQLFNTLDPATRRGLRRFVRGQGTYYAGRGRNARRRLPGPG